MSRLLRLPGRPVGRRSSSPVPLPDRAQAAAPASASGGEHAGAGVFFPLIFLTDVGTLSFFSTTTIFGTPIDITLSELAVESFFPADPATADAMRRLASQVLS